MEPFWPLCTSAGDCLLTCSHVAVPPRATSTGHCVLRRELLRKPQACARNKNGIHHLPNINKMRDRTTGSTLRIITGDSIHIRKPTPPDSTVSL